MVMAQCDWHYLFNQYLTCLGCFQIFLWLFEKKKLSVIFPRIISRSAVIIQELHIFTYGEISYNHFQASPPMSMCLGHSSLLPCVPPQTLPAGLLYSRLLSTGSLCKFLFPRDLTMLRYIYV
jgi:hypothetical protein